MSIQPGQTFSHYRIERLIGRGGMGEVFLAEDLNLGRKIALKVLPASMASDPDRLARFQREARAIAALNHPHIVTLYAVEEEEGTHFLTMELVEGQSLDRGIPPGGLPLTQVFDIGIALADALAAAHEKGVIHRDVKPANVAVTVDGRVKVLDFGLAKLAVGAPPGPLVSTGPTLAGPSPDDLTVAGTVVGTVPYMSPEQVKGRDVDARTDIFSLGVVLYELATGRRPFGGDTPAETLSAILRDEPRPLGEARPDTPRHLARIVEQCLRKDPDSRFQTAKDVRNQLRDLRREIESGAGGAESVPGSGAGATPGTPTPVPGAAPAMLRGSATAPSTRGRLTGLLAALAGVALVFIALGAYWLAGRHAAGRGPATPASAEATSIAVLPFADLSAARDQQYFADGLSEEMIDLLAKIPRLRVIGRTSSFQFKGKDADLRDIGRRLGVQHLLEGSVRKDGDRLRIGVQLIRAADGTQLWSQRYDRTLDDVFKVQDEIAGAVAGAMKVTLLAGTLEGRESTASGEAHNLFLQGEYFRQLRSKADYERAIAAYEKALELEPRYAPAWAGLASTYVRQLSDALIPTETGFTLARDAAKRALDLDPSLAMAHATLARVHQLQGRDWAAAEAELKQALDLDPGNIPAKAIAGLQSQTLGHFEEAMRLHREILDRDPLNTNAYGNLGLAAYYAGRLPEAEAAFRRKLELNPTGASTGYALGRVLLARGRLDSAEAAFKAEPAEGWRLAGLALVYHATGRKAAADATLQDLTRRLGSDWAWNIAEAHAYRGDIDEAFAWLERAYVQGDTGLSEIMGAPLLKSLESDPRYKPFLRKLKLPV